jgi:hypothetical protein
VVTTNWLVCPLTRGAPRAPDDIGARGAPYRFVSKQAVKQMPASDTAHVVIDKNFNVTEYRFQGELQ